MRYQNLALVAGAALALCCNDNSRVRPDPRAVHESFYGTLDAPSFHVVADLPDMDVSTFRSVAVPNYEARTTMLNNIMGTTEQTLAQMRDRFDGLEACYERLTMNGGIPASFRADLRSLNSICNRVQDEIGRPIVVLLEEDLFQSTVYARASDARMTPVEYEGLFDFVKQIFAEMTNRECPFRMSVRDLETNGSYDADNHEIVADRASYEITFLHLAHLLGYVCCQVKDRAEFDNRVSREVEVMEHACADAFAVAAIYHIDDEDLRDRCVVLNDVGTKIFISRHFDGNDSAMNEACAIADAAITHFGSPHAAYRYLCRTAYADISDEIIQIVKDNRQAYAAYKGAFDRYKLYIQEGEALRKRMNDLFERYAH